MEILSLKRQYFHTKLPRQKLMLRHIEGGVQNEAITENGVLVVTISFFWKLCFSIKTFKKSCFDVLTTQMSAFILFVSAGVFLGCVFPVNILKMVITGSSLTFTIAQEKHILFLKFSQEDVYVWWCVVFSHCIFFNLKITDAIKWNIAKH